MKPGRNDPFSFYDVIACELGLGFMLRDIITGSPYEPVGMIQSKL